MSTALVPIAPAKRPETVLSANPPAGAPFLAHLIAMARQAPQTRTRRRVEPSEAIAAYAALGQWPIRTGRGFSRSL